MQSTFTRLKWTQRSTAVPRLARSTIGTLEHLRDSFSVKVPQVITHEKVLGACDADLKEFLDTMSILGPKLGPIVFQFPFFNRSIFREAVVAKAQRAKNDSVTARGALSSVYSCSRNTCP